MNQNHKDLEQLQADLLASPLVLRATADVPLSSGTESEVVRRHGEHYGSADRRQSEGGPVPLRIVGEDIDLCAIVAIKHVAFAAIGRQYDSFPWIPIVRTGFPLDVQQRSVIRPYNVSRHIVLENRSPESHQQQHEG